MDDSDNDSPAGETPEGAEPAAARPMQPIGGMVRDPREVKTNPSLTKFLRERMSAAFVSSLVTIGVLRPRTTSGDLGPRHWKGLFGFLGAIFAIIFVWTSIHIVQPGTVAVPVTFGHAGKPLERGAAHHVAVHQRVRDDDAHAELHDVVTEGRGRGEELRRLGRGARP